MAWAEKEDQQLAEILKKYPAGRQLSGVLPALYLAQQEKNWLDEADIQAVADALDIPVTHVHSIIGFYTLFRKEHTGKYMVQVCTDLPCALRGADAFYQRFVERMGLPPGGGTTADGLFTVEEVVCLAACDKAPMCHINLEYFESLTDDGIDDIIASFREQALKEQSA
jgi:NADH-quinone oxidoreductase subunit E